MRLQQKALDASGVLPPMKAKDRRKSRFASSMIKAITAASNDTVCYGSIADVLC